MINALIYYVMQLHIEHIIMVNFSHILCCVVDYSWNKSSNPKDFQGFCLLKGDINLIIHNQIINRRLSIAASHIERKILSNQILNDSHLAKMKKYFPYMFLPQNV